MTTEDVEMAGDETIEEKSKDVNLLTLEDLNQQSKQIEKAVNSKEPRFILRVIRALPSTRKKLNATVMHQLITGFYVQSAEDKNTLLTFVDKPMETETAGSNFRPIGGKAATQPLLAEIDCYIHLLLVIYLIDCSQYSLAVKCADLLLKKISGLNRRSLDLIAAHSYFYYSQAYEHAGNLDQTRSLLLERLRTTTLRNDYEGQAVLINCLLRNYLQYDLFNQAHKLVEKSVFPEAANINQWARYMYYLGRIKAVQLEYSEAQKHLTQAARKAPQHTAYGFKLTVQKLAVTVDLLLGEIPEKSTFRHNKRLQRALIPYFKLTQALRNGDVQLFNTVVTENETQFGKDNTLNLIRRLRHNVIKTAVRMISLSYSKISLKDVATKLAVNSPDAAEYIVSKAIRDGVIDAVIDHSGGFVSSKERLDIYSTREPQLAFHQRIKFCLDIHNQSVKALRFPPKSYNKDLESAEERREREQQERELAN